MGMECSDRLGLVGQARDRDADLSAVPGPAICSMVGAGDERRPTGADFGPREIDRADVLELMMRPRKRALRRCELAFLFAWMLSRFVLCVCAVCKYVLQQRDDVCCGRRLPTSTDAVLAGTRSVNIGAVQPRHTPFTRHSGLIASYERLGYG